MKTKEPMTKKELAEYERQAAVDHLKGLLSPGLTVYTLLRHRSASGMFRVIDLLIVTDEGEIQSIGRSAAVAMNDKHDRERDGIRISGCGMDMGFHLVYNLGSALWPDGTPNPHGTRNGQPDSTGGYALKHRWL